MLALLPSILREHGIRLGECHRESVVADRAGRLVVESDARDAVTPW